MSNLNKLVVMLLILIFGFTMMSNSQISTDLNNPIDTDETELVYAQPYNFIEYSYYWANSYSTQLWVSSVYSGLLTRDTGTGAWLGDLATDLPSRNNRTYTFTLRNGLTFETGNALTADDVVFSYQVALTPDINQVSYSMLSNYIDSYTSIVKVDSQTIQITLNQDYGLAYHLFDVAIIDQQVWQAKFDACLAGDNLACNWNAADGSDVVGTAGPYIFSSFDSANKIIEVAKNPNYWDSSSVLIDRIKFINIMDNTVALSEFANGRVDILDARYKFGQGELNGIPNVTEYFTDDTAHSELALNHQHEYFGTGNLVPDSGPNIVSTNDDDQARYVRRAMSHMLDRDYYSNVIMDGFASPANSPVPSVTPGWDESIPYDPYNVSLAMGFMEKAGFDYANLSDSNSDGYYETFFFNITVLTPNTQQARNQWSQMWSDQLAQIGIGTTYISTGWAEIVPRTFGSPSGSLVPTYDNGGFDVLFVGYSWNLDWDPSGLYTQSGLCTTGSCSNFMNYQNSTVEAKINQYLTEVNETARNNYFQQLQNMLAYDYPVIAVLYPSIRFATYSTVGGFDPLLFIDADPDWRGLSSTRMAATTVTSTASETVSETVVSTVTATETTTVTGGATETVTETYPVTTTTTEISNVTESTTITETSFEKVVSNITETVTDNTAPALGTPIAALPILAGFTAFAALYRSRSKDKN